MIFVLLDYKGGIDGFIGTTLIQPFIGAILSVITITICLIVGLPVRISHTINAWWKKKYFIGIGLMGIGLILLAASFVFTQTYDEADIPGEIPNTTFAICGWFVSAFSVLHIFPSENVVTKIETALNKFIGKK